MHASCRVASSLFPVAPRLHTGREELLFPLQSHGRLSQGTYSLPFLQITTLLVCTRVIAERSLLCSSYDQYSFRRQVVPL
jgi:hypothetical protein